MVAECSAIGILKPLNLGSTMEGLRDWSMVIHLTTCYPLRGSRYLPDVDHTLAQLRSSKGLQESHCLLRYSLLVRHFLLVP